MLTTENITQRIIHRRKIDGISAVLLPYNERGQIDFDSFAQLLSRVVSAGLTPAVNMDTGFVNLLTKEERRAVLEKTREVLAGKKFVAGAFIEGESGEPYTLYAREVEAIHSFGGTPILFQCSALKHLSAADLVMLYRNVAAHCVEMLAFELGEMFAPFGQIYPLNVVRGWMEIPQLVGMKHSSLDRKLEWERLALRDEVRPSFKIYTGNDLGIDMVMYGSDYLLGLSTFAPDAFALRDAYWANGDARFYELNDWLQYLGMFAFRPPVPAYKHNAAMFLKLRGWIANDCVHPNSPRRPESDVAILRESLARLETFW
jgi:dihydrodipicolinate synthase/N-acetylneuraminate lyase